MPPLDDIRLNFESNQYEGYAGNTTLFPTADSLLPIIEKTMKNQNKLYVFWILYNSSFVLNTICFLSFAI